MSEAVHFRSSAFQKHRNSVHQMAARVSRGSDGGLNLSCFRLLCTAGESDVRNVVHMMQCMECEG